MELLETIDINMTITSLVDYIQSTILLHLAFHRVLEIV
jgi:hypothetical protein